MNDFGFGYVLAIFLSLLISIIYGVWWFGNCADKPYYNAPMMCNIATEGK